jgi:uncharacterized membrane protein YphA (DoxX/SURF4 family)
MKTGRIIKKIFSSPYLALILRLYIGGIFIYASMYKINYAGEFAETIASYQLVPFWAVNFLAVVMPWMELFTGLLMVVGVRAKSAAVLIAAMLAVFIIAIAINLLRETPIGCGCFRSIEEPLSWKTLVRDVVWLAMAIQVYFCDSVFQLERKFAMAVKEL